ncbi:Patatin [Rhizobium sp. PDO1-076]|uniref:patatin-like phospholipase family protein n=1 Tax=Rhizobium sp. PDO1-076 TaxID=1125979 RepID=UPI00024E38F3|nr:patatin-like phospholipase family protein [Rhizobium sp. PDO1-076]EHS53325.1 Patatin [Rhizobium sp. PDO1-076]
MPDNPTFDAIGFAGGGNRCYWQSGFFQSLNATHPVKPKYYVAVSAGAYHCVMNVAGVGERVREAAFSFAERGLPGLDWSKLRMRQSPLVVGALFRQLLTEQFGTAELAALKAAPPILIQLSRPPAWMPGGLAAIGSIAAYQLEKAVTSGVHSRAGGYLGLKPTWISTHDIEAPADLVDAIMATSSVPPFMPIGRIRGVAHLDGGLVDNPPLRKLAETERQGGRTLLLSTRYGRPPPHAPNRHVVSPSEDLPVNKFAVGDAKGLCHAFELGLRDGAAFAKTLATA